MRKKDKILLVIGIVLLIISFFVVRKLNQNAIEKRKIEQNFEFPETITINNTTKFNIDTTIMIVLHEIFKHDTVHIDIYYLTNNLMDNDYIIQAHIIKHYFIPHTYILYLNRYINNNELLYIIIHELIHLHQYETNSLIIVNDFNGGNYYIYLGDKHKMSDVDYYNREYEQDAYNKTQEILNIYFDIIKK